MGNKAIGGLEQTSVSALQLSYTAPNGADVYCVVFIVHVTRFVKSLQSLKALCSYMQLQKQHGEAAKKLIHDKKYPDRSEMK